MTHTVIRQVGQGDQCTAAHAPNDHDIGNLADQIVTLHGGQLSTGCTLEGGDSELEQIDQGLRTTGSTPEGFQRLTGCTNLGHIPLRYGTGVEQGQQFTEGVGPTSFTVLDDDGDIRIDEGFSDCRQVGDELTLHREADTGTTHQDVEDFIKGTYIVNGDKGAVEACHWIAFQRRTSSHHGSHGGHDFQVLNGTLYFFPWVMREFVVKVGHITFHCFSPGFTTIFFSKPTSVTALMNILL